jgi:hypothetical protein
MPKKGLIQSVKDAIWAEKGKPDTLPVGRGGETRRGRIDDLLENMERGTPDRMRRNQSTDRSNE